MPWREHSILKKLYCKSLDIMEKFFNNSLSKQYSLKDKSELLQILTVLLMALVVFGHAIRMYTSKSVYSYMLQDTYLIVEWMTSFLYSFHMPAFVAVSGGVFYIVKEELHKYDDTRKFVKKKILRLIIPYYAFLFLIVTPTLVLTDVVPLTNLLGFIKGNLIFIGDSRHLWYLPMLFGIFVIFHFAYQNFKNHTLISIIICIIVWILSSWVHNILVSNIFHYFVYFYIGYLIMGYLDYLNFIKSNWFIISSIILIILSLAYLGSYATLITAIVGTIMCFGLSIRLNNVLNTKSALITGLKQNSYGIYLFHPMIIYLFFFYFSQLVVNPYLGVILLFFSSFGISYALTEGVRQVGLRFIIGE